MANERYWAREQTALGRVLNDNARHWTHDHYSKNAIATLEDARGNFVAANASLKMQPDNTARENDMEIAATALWVAATVVLRDPVSLQLAITKGMDPSALQKQATMAREDVDRDREARRESLEISVEGFGQRFIDKDGIERQVVIGRSGDGDCYFSVVPIDQTKDHSWKGPYDSKRDAMEHAEMALKGVEKSSVEPDRQIDLDL